MPRTELPKKQLIGIHPAINCNFCAHKSKDAEIRDSDLLFTTACPGFKLMKYIFCREGDNWIDWQVCAWRHYTDAHSCCKNCSIGEGMVDIANALEYKIPE